MLFDAIDRALTEGKKWDDAYAPLPLAKLTSFALFLEHVPTMVRNFDQFLFNGVVFQYLNDANIPFRAVGSETGVSGLTTYSKKEGMVMAFNEHAWIHLPPPTKKTPRPAAMAGGELCFSAPTCLYEVVKHEFVHVVMFSLFLSLDMSNSDIQNMKSYFDPQHNVVFTHMLLAFFGQPTIDNSLQIRDAEFNLTFDRNVKDIEQQCIRSGSSENMRVWYENRWQAVDYGQETTPHHSFVITRGPRPRNLVIPNGLLSCD